MSKQDITFSVMVPAYKKRFFKECIDSVMAQTYTQFELIIVNDASPENLDEVVDLYDDPRIRYYKNDVGFGARNVVGNWNKCLGYATGDFVICMGDDDKLLPNCLADYVTLINKYPDLDVYHTRTEYIDENSNVFYLQNSRYEFESVYSMIWHRINGREQILGDILFRTSTLKGNGGFYNLPYAWCSDEVSSYIACGKKGIANSYIPGFQFRISTINISSKTDNTKGKIEALKLYKKWILQFLLNEPENKLDKLYRLLALANLQKSLKKHFVHNLSSDFHSHFPFHLFSHLKKRKEYGLSFSDVLKCYLKSSKDVFSR